MPCPSTAARPGCRAGLESLTDRDPAVCELCGSNGQPACKSNSGSYLCSEKDTTPYKISGAGAFASLVCVPCGRHNQIACDRKANTLSYKGFAGNGCPTLVGRKAAPEQACCAAETASCKACKSGVTEQEWCGCYPDTAGCPDGHCDKGTTMADSVEVRRCYNSDMFKEWTDKGSYTHYSPQMLEDIKSSGVQYNAEKEDGGGGGGVITGVIAAVLGTCLGGGAVLAVTKKRASGGVRRAPSITPANMQPMAQSDLEDPSASQSNYALKKEGPAETCDV
eukprot:Hpha_TRINITY_DN15756_c4_g13::TRINITY_DN15756_c4_g13_i2::g.39978::m.39978